MAGEKLYPLAQR